MANPLAVYLSERSLTQTEFAERFSAATGRKVRQQQISRWALVGPPWMYRVLIARVTRGAVPVEAWPEKPATKPRKKRAA